MNSSTNEVSIKFANKLKGFPDDFYQEGWKTEDLVTFPGRCRKYTITGTQKALVRADGYWNENLEGWISIEHTLAPFSYFLEFKDGCLIRMVPRKTGIDLDDYEDRPLACLSDGEWLPLTINGKTIVTN